MEFFSKHTGSRVLQEKEGKNSPRGVLMQRVKNLYNRKFSFYELALVFFLTGCVEIAFRVSWAPTSVSFLFPALTFFMYRTVTLRPVNIKRTGWLLLPFILFSAFFSLLFFGNDFLGIEKIWKHYFPVVYLAVTLVYIAPVVTGMYRRSSFVQGGQEIFFIHFISSAQIVGTLLLFIIQNIDEEAAMTASGRTGSIAPRWSMLLLLVVVVLLLFHYLVSTWKLSGTDRQVIKNMMSYKETILYLFNEKKIFLDYELTLGVLSLETKIDKQELELFFNGYLGKSFSFFVAEYRVAHAIKLIDNEGDRYTLQTIACESGFRSKATFNKYFKLITGLLPSEFLTNKKA